MNALQYAIARSLRQTEEAMDAYCRGVGGMKLKDPRLILLWHEAAGKRVEAYRKQFPELHPGENGNAII